MTTVVLSALLFSVVAFSSGVGALTHTSTSKQAPTATQTPGTLAFELHAFARARTGADDLSPEQAQAFSGLSAADVRLNPADAALSRKLIDSPRGPISIVPNAGGLYTFVTPTYASSTRAVLTPNRPVIFGGVDADQAGSGSPLFLFGMASNAVKAIEVSALGTTTEATLSNNGWHWTAPNGAIKITDAVVVARLASGQKVVVR